MKIHISFSEIQKFVAAHYGKDITLQSINKQAIRIGVSVTSEMPDENMGLFGGMKSLFTKAVSQIARNVTLDVSVEDVSENRVTLRYGGGLGKELLIQAVMRFFKTVNPQYAGMVEDMGNSCLRMSLKDIPQMANFCEIADLKDLYFEENHIVIEMELK